MISTLLMWSPLQSPAFLSVCTPGALAPLSLLSIFKQQRSQDLHFISCILNKQHAGQAITCMYICMCRKVCQICISPLAAIVWNLKQTRGSCKQPQQKGETVTDILIDSNSYFTCRLLLLLVCTTSRHASLSCNLHNIGRLVLHSRMQRSLNYPDILSRQA